MRVLQTWSPDHTPVAGVPPDPYPPPENPQRPSEGPRVLSSRSSPTIRPDGWRRDNALATFDRYTLAIFVGSGADALAGHPSGTHHGAWLEPR